MLAGLSVDAVFALVCAGLALDWMFGEPRRAHPLVGFGRIVETLERALNRGARRNALRSRLLGAGAVAVLIAMPAIMLSFVMAHIAFWPAAAVHALVLYFSVGAKSLCQHARAVADALAGADLVRARVLGARIVTRDLHDASASDVARAAVESTLENGNDAVFAALFWFVIAGAPGALACRLANTLDAMWGYKTARYFHFGWAAARLDDFMNYVPARLTALTYALLGNTREGLRCWRTQANAWASPNAGPVMAAGAGALELALGGPAWYDGRIEHRPPLGAGTAPGAADIGRAQRLVHSGTIMWVAVLAIFAGVAVYA